MRFDGRGHMSIPHVDVAHGAWPILIATIFAACASASTQTSSGGTARTASGRDTVQAPRAQSDSAPGLPPAGFGTLRQDDISLRLDNSSLQIRATPLDESIIRLLS